MMVSIPFRVCCLLLASVGIDSHVSLEPANSHACRSGTFHSSGHNCQHPYWFVSGLSRCLGTYRDSGSNYATAVSYCNDGDQVGGTVVLPGSVAENNRFRRYWSDNSAIYGRHQNLWGGSKRGGRNEPWDPGLVHTDRGVDPWESGQPSDDGGNEPCLQIKSNGKWNDEGCNNNMRVMCWKSFQCASCSSGECAHGQYRPACTSTADQLCIACTAGTYGGKMRTADCTDTCGAGSQLKSDRSGCDTCGANSYSSGGAMACTACGANQFSAAGSGSCTNCPAGQTSISGQACGNCPADQSSSSGGACSNCPAGKSSVAGGLCLNCNAGQSSISGAPCEACTAGKISSAGQAPCQDCLAGQEDTNSFQSCRWCTPGKISASAGTRCTFCAARSSSASPFTQCHVCPDRMTSDGVGGPCAVFTCSPGFFAPTDLVSIAWGFDKQCMPCPYNSISAAEKTVCVMCPVGKYADDLKTACVPCMAADLAKVYPYIEVVGYGSSQWTWLTRLPLRSIRSPCTCDSGYMALDNGGGVCVACNAAQVSHSLDLLLTLEGTAFTYQNVNYNLLSHPTGQGLCQSCDPGSRSDHNPANQRVRCVQCTVGKYKDFPDQFQCLSCRAGMFAKSAGQAVCVSCAKCPQGEFRSGCGSTPFSSDGTCSTCFINCGPGMMSTACINRVGVAGFPPICKHKEFLTRTPLCQIDALNPARVDRGLGLGGFDFETIFGGSENEVDFQCSRVCDAQGADAGTVDTMTCDGPFACNRKACSMESSYIDTDLREFRLGRACPVEMSEAEAANPLVHVDAVNSKRRAACQKCSECGDRGALVETHGLRDWGRGCASECSRIECSTGEIYDWTDHSCKTCAQLSNVSLCAHDEITQDALAVQDVSGYRAKILFRGCHAKPSSGNALITYGQCECCRNANLETDCSEGTAAASYHAGCTEGCALCMMKQNRVLTSRLKYVSMLGRQQPLYCQLRECAQDGEARAQTGLKDFGAMCVSPCVARTCEPDEVQLECTLPHNTRCRRSHPAARRGERVLGHVPAHANLFEHPDSAKFHFSSFENVLVNVDALHDGNKHQCVWNAVDIRDNDMNPAGISFTFFPPAKTYAFELTEYGSKFCHLWDRNPRLEYPMLPLQNTVSFDSVFPRRLLLNASARVMHYDYSGAGHERVPDQLRLPRPAAFASVFAGDLYMSIDLLNTPNATLAALVPSDRQLAAATWIPSFVFSAVVADATARSAAERPALLVRAGMLARTRRQSFALSVSVPPAVAPASVTLAGVHCEPMISNFAAPPPNLIGNGGVWVSANDASGPATPLAVAFPEMLLARGDVFGPDSYHRALGPVSASVSRLRSSPHTHSCHLYAVVGESTLMCHDLRVSSPGRRVLFGAVDAMRVEPDSRIVDVCVIKDVALVVMQLSGAEGQQILAYYADTAQALEVQYTHQDVVAMGSSLFPLPGDRYIWVLRKLISNKDRHFTLERRALSRFTLSGGPALGLSETDYSLPHILNNVFDSTSDIPLSDTDTYEMAVSDANSVFVLFALVDAEQRIMQIYEHGLMAPVCTLVSQYPGLDSRLASSAWTSSGRVVLYFQDFLFSASCVGGRLELRAETESTLPRHPFVLYGASYLSLGGGGALILYSDIRARRLSAPAWSASGVCVFARASSTINIHRHANAHLRASVVIVDSAFAVEQLVDYEQEQTVSAVHSLRALSPGELYVRVLLTPTAKLPQSPLHPYIRGLAGDGTFWSATAVHFIDIQVALPCSAALWFAGHTVRSGGEQCGDVGVVLHVELMESWSIARSPQYQLWSADVFVRYTNGTVSQRELARAGSLAHAEFQLRLYDGAQLTQLLEVDRFSSVYFKDVSLKPLAACATCGWQRLRFFASAHAVQPEQPMLVQVHRQAEALEKWSTQRSLAVDALQLLIVLTTSVSASVQRRGPMPPGVRNTGWLEHKHCCITMDLFGACTDDPIAMATQDMQTCSEMMFFNGQHCAAKSFVRSKQECHCHSTCAHTDVKTTIQTGIFLFVGRV